MYQIKIFSILGKFLGVDGRTKDVMIEVDYREALPLKYYRPMRPLLISDQLLSVYSPYIKSISCGSITSLGQNFIRQSCF